MNKRSFFYLKLVLCIMGVIGAATIGFSTEITSVGEFLILLIGLVACILFAFVGDP